MKKLLRRLLTPIARLPIIGPHEGHEADLLLAKAKPLGVSYAGHMFRKEDIARLDVAVEKGELIKSRLKREITYQLSFYVTPDKKEKALEGLHLNEEKISNDGNLPHEKEERLRVLDKELGTGSLIQTEPEKIEKIFDKIVVKIHPVLPHTAFDLWKKKEEIKYRRQIREINAGRRHFLDTDTSSRNCQKKIENLMKKNILIEETVDLSRTDNSGTIYGQPGQEENIKELSEIFTFEANDKNCENQEEIEKNEQKRGILLGYSDKDIFAWLNRPRKQDATLSEKFLFYTNHIRRPIRQILMKWAGPEWKRNF